MLEAIFEDSRVPLRCDDYQLTRAYNGQDSIRFTLSRRDPAAQLLRERGRIRETTTNQLFLISGIDAGQRTITYALKKDLSDWERVVYPGYTNGSAQSTALTTITGILPEGWSLTTEGEQDDLMAYITLEGPTPLEVVEQCSSVYGCTLTYDNVEQVAVLQFPGTRTLGTAFLTEGANLRAAPEYKSTASALVTRLYARGAEGLDFSQINDGKSYVECYDYTEERIAGFWQDERYTVAEHLLAAAKAKIKRLSQPERSWSLSICDLHGLDASAWPGLALELYDVVLLIDPTLGQRMQAQITELRQYPHHPEKNEISIVNV